MKKRKILSFPRLSSPKSYTIRTTITLSHDHHPSLIRLLETSQNKAYAIRELMIRGYKALSKELENEKEIGS